MAGKNRDQHPKLVIHAKTISNSALYQADKTKDPTNVQPDINIHKYISPQTEIINHPLSEPTGKKKSVQKGSTEEITFF